MTKSPELEKGRQVMSQAANWGLLRWLTEKGNVRRVADSAVQALEAMERAAKAGWTEEIRSAYADAKEPSSALGSAARKVREADELAEKARLDAEATFAEGDRRRSVSLARDGTRKALEAWDLRERAILMAEALSKAALGG